MPQIDKPSNKIIGFPPIILSFTYNHSRQTAGMTYYVHEEEEHFRGLRLHCTDRRCLWENDALEGFDQLYNRLTLKNPNILVLVEEKIRENLLNSITAVVGDNVTQLPGKAFELRDTELLSAFTKPPRLWQIGQAVAWDEERAVTPVIMSLIRFGNERPEIVRSALALVKYLQTKYDDVANLLKLRAREHRCRIDFEFSSLDNVVSIDRNTLYALNVFRIDDHPSTVRPKGRAKEGFSMNSFLECFVVSAGGKKLLREWCLQPTRDLHELRMRQESIQMLMMSKLRPLVETARKGIASWKSSASLWGNLCTNVSFDNMEDWKRFVRDQERLVETLNVFEKLDEEGVPCVKGIGKAIAPLRKSLIFLEMMLDFSKLDEIDDPLVRLKTEVDATLADAREKYNNVSLYLNGLGVLEEEYSFESRGHFLPSFGFCVSMGPNDEPPKDFALKFTMNGRLFFKTKYCKVIDEKLGALYLEIRTREIHLLGALVQHMRPVYDYWLEIVAQVYDQFDVLTGLAYCAAQYNWTKPIFVQKPVAHIERGTHPLVEHVLDTDLSKEGIQRSFIPNDTFMGGTHAPIHVITGANCSGKSVYLKQVGLLHFLAHIGSYVPAKSCHIGLTDMIFSRIRTLESASVQLSAFEIDVSQMSRILQSATENSLILVDEFGKGTRPDDGAALLASCILHVADRKPVPPRAILTTHYPEIFTLKLVTHPLVQSYFMGTEKGEKKGSGTRSLEYLYTLHPGVCVRSFGIECAELAGIPTDILSRAVEIFNHLENGDGIPTFEVKALHMLRAFDWEEGNKRSLIRRLRDILDGKGETSSANDTNTPCNATPAPREEKRREIVRRDSRLSKAETPPDYRSGLDPRGTDIHCSAPAMGSAYVDQKSGFDALGRPLPNDTPSPHSAHNYGRETRHERTVSFDSPQYRNFGGVMQTEEYRVGVRNLHESHDIRYQTRDSCRITADTQYLPRGATEMQRDFNDRHRILVESAQYQSASPKAERHAYGLRDAKRNPYGDTQHQRHESPSRFCDENRPLPYGITVTERFENSRGIDAFPPIHAQYGPHTVRYGMNTQRSPGSHYGGRFVGTTPPQDIRRNRYLNGGDDRHTKRRRY